MSAVPEVRCVDVADPHRAEEARNKPTSLRMRDVRLRRDVFRSLQVSFRQAGPPQLAASLRHDVACCPQSEHFDTESCSPMDIGWVGCPPRREAVMPDANLFQEFAKEGLQQASKVKSEQEKAKSEQEKLALNELALALGVRCVGE